MCCDGGWLIKAHNEETGENNSVFNQVAQAPL